MPGRGSYGPGGKWVHDRAHRIMSEGKTTEKYGPERGKQVAYAIATQQAHKLGKTPKKKGGYGTPTGRRVAKAKFDQPRKVYQKTASGAGQDLRMPILGGTRFPTDDSKSFAKQQLKSSQKVGEVGPTPSPKQLRPKGPSMKLGAAMSEDPLIQYLKDKKASAIRKEGVMGSSLGRKLSKKIMGGIGSLFKPKVPSIPKVAALDDNLEAMPKGEGETEVASECPMPKGELTSQPARDKTQLGKLFDHQSKEAKYLARMHPATSGSVDRVLKRH